MGRFGISFSDDKSGGFKIDRRKHYATVVNDGGERKDGPFQRCLAWCSYFVMVFVAICTFNSPAVAGAVDATVKPVLILNKVIDQKISTVQDREGDPWTLRGTR